MTGGALIVLAVLATLLASVAESRRKLPLVE